MQLSGKDLAEKIGCARSTLSEATKNGHLVDGRWDVQEWAVCGPSGRLKHYDVPDQVAFLNAERRENPPEEANSPEFGGDSAPAVDTPEPDLGVPSLTAVVEEQGETVRTVAEEAGDTTQLVSDETDVEGTARNAGMAYAAGKAIEYDTPGARTFWTVGSALVGGIGGHAVTEGNPWGVLIGALTFGGAGYFVYGQQPRHQEGASRTQQTRSRQPAQMNASADGSRSSQTRSLAVNLSR